MEDEVWIMCSKCNHYEMVHWDGKCRECECKKMTEDIWEMNPKVTQWSDMFRSWGMKKIDAMELVLDMWMKLPFDIRLTDPEDDGLK